MKRMIILFLIIIIMFSISGCWDRKEPEDRAIIIGAGYDYNPETDMYKIIAQFESSLVAQEQVGGTSDKPAYWTVSAWGVTPIEAVANIRKKLSRELYYAHLQLLIISERMARTKGILTVMETLARSRQSRPIIEIAVAKGEVEKILTVDFPIEPANVLGLLGQIDITEGELGTAIKQNARRFLNKLSTPGIEPIAISMELLEQGKKLSDSKSKPDSPPPIKLTGLTAFYQDKMKGWLNDSQARGWNWISGESPNGIINFTYPGAKDTKVTVIAHRNSNKITPYIEDNKPGIRIEIDVTGRIESITGLNYFKEESKITESMENRLAEAVRLDMKKAITKARSLKTDIFGFGNCFYRLKYDKWLTFRENWQEIFVDIPVEIEVKAAIKRAGLVNRGIKLR